MHTYIACAADRKAEFMQVLKGCACRYELLIKYREALHMNKKKRILAVLLVVVALSATGCTAGLNRSMKNISSNFTGGLNRTVTVYDMQGEPIKEYTGKIDVEANEGKVLFDLDGKRTIIYNATVIVQEN